MIPTEQEEESRARSWMLGVGSLVFIFLQSLCTAVMALSGIQFLIGAAALTGASGLLLPLKLIHANGFRIPMMAVAVLSSLATLYSVWRVRSLRARPASQWRAQTLSVGKRRGENVQIAMGLLTLGLVVAEEVSHRIVQGVF